MKILILILLLMGPLAFAQLTINDPQPDIQFFAVDNNPSQKTFFDWRNHNGQNWVSTVRNQNGCGSCVAFGVASGVESQMIINSGFSWWRPLISVQELFFCGGGDCSTGWWPDAAFDRIKNLGVPDESCAPYVLGQINKDQLCHNTCADHVERRYKIFDAPKITTGVIDKAAIKQALEHGPLVAIMSTLSDFHSYKGWGVYKASESAVFVAGHTVIITGYDDSKKAWIIKNSWGDQWGDQGYGLVYNEDRSALGSTTWKILAPQFNGFVGIRNVQEGSVLSGLQKIIIETNRSDATETRLKVYSVTGSEIKTFSCVGPGCEMHLNTAEIPDGAYEFTTELIKDEQVLLTGYRHRYSILNANPQSLVWLKQSPEVISMQSSDDGALEFYVNTNSDFIPAELQFTVLNADKTVVTKTTKNAKGLVKVKWWNKGKDVSSYSVFVEKKINIPQGQFTSRTQKIKLNF